MFSLSLPSILSCHHPPYVIFSFLPFLSTFLFTSLIILLRLSFPYLCLLAHLSHFLSHLSFSFHSLPPLHVSSSGLSVAMRWRPNGGYSGRRGIYRPFCVWHRLKMMSHTLGRWMGISTCGKDWTFYARCKPLMEWVKYVTLILKTHWLYTSRHPNTRSS